MVARLSAYPLGATSSTRIATTSQPRSLLSIARLKSARSRLRPSIRSLVLMDHTWFGRGYGRDAFDSQETISLWRYNTANKLGCCEVVMQAPALWSLAARDGTKLIADVWNVNANSTLLLLPAGAERWPV